MGAPPPHTGQPVYTQYREYGNPTHSSGGGGSVFGWFVMAGAAAGVIGCFLPLTPDVDASLYDIASGANAVWLYLSGMIVALIVGLVVALAGLSRKACWYALAGIAAGLAGSFILTTFITMIQFGGERGGGIGFWLLLIGSVIAMIFSIIGAFAEGK
ncbi:MAG: hypothetical protein WAO58_01135 [Fimbriimonadaceae bacterium]